MNCPNCQTPNRDDGRFCISCGSALPQPPAPAFQQPAPAYMPTAPQAGYPAQGSYAPVAPVYAPAPQAPDQAPAAQGGLLAAPDYALVPLTRVVVTDVNMTFQSMVVFMVKWAIAAVPALIILSLIVLTILAVFGSIIGGLLGALLY